ncbi:MAG: SDR family NAD(P)-dependent oxidoreductase [Gammaproteobacteria bacterium]|nr:SDR family NAD(P)-dependent oxidoreductase [Gammaproteobacteria bacterium]MDH5171339.1 SDR family NAD(P)-dependent oxidoreductase [Gammaproteobacteria bacterium]
MHSLQKLARRYPHKRVLVTGATNGLGKALALQFAAAGFRVAVASRDPAKVAATVDEVNRAGGEGLALTLDVTRLEDFESAVAAVGAAWGGLDILVNNAGILTAGKMADVGREVWEQSLRTDLWSVIDGCRLFLPLLERSGGGHIVNVASAAGLVAGPDLGTYNIAKAAVVSLSETLGVELADRNIDVTVSCPTIFKSHLIAPEGHEGDVVIGITAQGLAADMERTSYSSEYVAASLVRAMARRRLYDLPQRDARLCWWMARAFPETFRKLLLFMYRRRLWIFRGQ